MEELEPGPRHTYNGRLKMDPVLLGYDKDLVVAHYMGIEKLEEAVIRKRMRTKMITYARRASYFIIPALALYELYF